MGEPDKPVTKPEKPVAEPDKAEPVPAPKPVAPTGLAVSMADAFLKSAEVQSIAGSSPVLLLMAPRTVQVSPSALQPMAVAMIQRIQANSGFRFADPGQVAAITGQLEYQRGMNPASLVRLGRQTGAGYMLYGDLVSEGSRYRLAMSLMWIQERRAALERQPLRRPLIPLAGSRSGGIRPRL